MVKVLDGATKSHWVGLLKIIRNFYLGMASMTSMALQKIFTFFKTVIKVFKAFKVVAP